MVRRNLMLAVLDKQRRLLDSLVDQLGASSDDEQNRLLLCVHQAEQIASNLNHWVITQRHYDAGIRTEGTVKNNPSPHHSEEMTYL